MPGSRALLIRLLIASATLAVAATTNAPGNGLALAEADSDVAVEASLIVKFDDLGRFAALRERWTFGYDFTMAARPGVDPDGNGLVDPAELAAAMGDGLSWMQRVDYFTRISENGRRIVHGPAEDVAVSFPAGRLTVEFTLPLLQPPRTAIQTIEVSDPDLFYEIRYGTPDVAGDAMPDYCSIARRSPTASTIAVDVRCR